MAHPLRVHVGHHGQQFFQNYRRLQRIDLLFLQDVLRQVWLFTEFLHQVAGHDLVADEEQLGLGDAVVLEAVEDAVGFADGGEQLEVGLLDDLDGELFARYLLNALVYSRMPALPNFGPDLEKMLELVVRLRISVLAQLLHRVYRLLLSAVDD